MVIAIGVVFVAVVARLVMVQAVNASGYAAYGVSERTRAIALPALRGSILDSSGNVLAMSVTLTTIYADPHQVTDPRLEAQELAPILNVTESTLQTELSADAGFVYLAHTVSNQVADKVKALNLPGIAYLPQAKRYEPDGNLAASLLGSVNYAGQGSSGVEYQYNLQLAGKAGLVRVQQGLGGQDIPGTYQQISAAIPGQSLELTINSALQYKAETLLGQEIVAAHAKGGVALLMQTGTGKILAMAQLVANPKNPSAVLPAPSDTAVTQVYEPGSVMKGVTYSAALQAGVVTPNTRFTVPYSVPLGGYVIHDAEYHPPENWSVADDLAYSSNVGTLHVSQLAGADRIYRYMRAFGLGSKTDLGIPGESRGLLPPPSQWSASSIGTIPIGQGVAVTAMQVLEIYNTIANGGVYVPPRLVDGWVNASGVLTPIGVPAPHRVISAGTARQMSAMLEDVVRAGTGTAAAVTGYDVSGKTGTSQIPYGNKPGYQPGAFNGTFVGFAPSEDPQLTAVVVLNRPTPVYYGGSVAAPVFSQLMAYALSDLQIPPVQPGKPGWNVPPIDASAANLASPEGGGQAVTPTSAPPAGGSTSPSGAPGRSASG